MAKLIGMKGEVKNKIISFSVASIVVIGLLLMPSFIDPIILDILPLQCLKEDDELVQYLRSVQDDDGVFVGLHGWEHKCPITGEDFCEFYNPNPEVSIPTKILEEKFEKGFSCFKSAGLKMEWFSFPGMEYDNRSLAILEERGFIPVHYVFFGQNWSTIEVLDSSMLSEIFDYMPSNSTFGEYTWLWRDEEFASSDYEQALLEFYDDNPDGIMFHIQDLNDVSLQFLDEVLNKTKFLKVYDIVIEHKSECEQLVNLGKKHGVAVFLCVIPTYKTPSEALAWLPWINFSWHLFVFGFAGLSLFFVTWAWLGRRSRKIDRVDIEDQRTNGKVILLSPAYNEEELIEDCVNGLGNQTYDPKQVLIVDDGSTDRTPEILKEVVRINGNGIKVVTHLKNLGKPEALNTGFKHASGDITVFSDSDSDLDEDFAKRVVKHFKDEDVGMVAGYIAIKNNNKIQTMLQEIEYIFSQLVVRFCQLLSRNVLICPGAGTAMRTEIGREIPSTDRTLTEDADTSFLVRKAGWKISQEIEAVSYTDAPETLKAFFSQRARWLYGVWQTIRIHKWSWKDPWVIWALLGYLLNPLSIFFLLLAPWIALSAGWSFVVFWIVYTTFAFAIFAITRFIPLVWAKKKKYVALLPLYGLYQLMLNGFLFLLLMAWVTRRGVTVRYGGKNIHAL